MSNDFKAIVDGIVDLPPMPAVAVEVLNHLQGGEYTARQLAETLARDPVLSARVLSIANSAFYSVEREVSSLEWAVVILGENTLKSLVLAASLKDINSKSGPVEKRLLEDAIGCALGARLVAQRFHSAEPEEAFLGGLFRHVGKMVMNNHDQERYRQLSQAVDRGEGTTADLEGKHFPISHAVLGAAVLDKWNFPKALIQSTLHHDYMAISLDQSPAIYRLCATVNIAGCLCRRLGIGRQRPDRTVDLSQIPGAVALGIEGERLEELLDELNEVFQENVSNFFVLSRR